MDDVEFCSRGKAIGVREFVCEDTEVARAVANEAIEGKIWFFFLGCMGVGAMDMGIRAVLLSARLHWLLASVVRSVERYYVLVVKVADALLC